MNYFPVFFENRLEMFVDSFVWYHPSQKGAVPNK